MKRIIRLIVGALIAAMCFTGANALNNSSANASAQAVCSGVKMDHKWLKLKSGAIVGEVVVYYNSSTGKNCAVVNHLGAAYGKPTYTHIDISRCAQTTRVKDQKGCSLVSGTYSGDTGSQYKYYAGPVSVFAPRNCVWVTGWFRWNGESLYDQGNFITGCPER